MKLAMLGATKGIGKALARHYAARHESLVLMGRDHIELERMRADLLVRGAKEVSTVSVDLERPPGFETALDQAFTVMGGLDALVISAGLFDTQQMLETDKQKLQRLLTVNFSHTILFCEHAKDRFLNQLRSGSGKQAKLCVFTSVAGERGRKPVVLYGASKAGLSHYLEGLDHLHHQDGLNVIDVRPGFVRTSMTDGLKAPPFAANPEDIAPQIAEGIDANMPVIYAPLPWQAVMGVVRNLPRFMMRNAKF